MPEAGRRIDLSDEKPSAEADILPPRAKQRSTILESPEDVDLTDDEQPSGRANIHVERHLDRPDQPRTALGRP
ncbi:hypothetical protein ACN27F_24530 [Solwaraspora sp. WMMB335]|uniref:hypothetical protein n=1 Tax=Solwaraspora sp. WMMB335 TaxID=3404118 RepID=UPI003B927FE4